MKTLVLALMVAATPLLVNAQLDPDLPVSVTAGCFSVCEGNVNVKGVQGNVTITNGFSTTQTVNATVKVQCNGVDVPNATQTLGPQSVNALSNTVLPYSISFTPVAGCQYTVVTTATISQLGPNRPSTVTTSFTADCVDQPCGTVGCTLTQGYWKNHPDKWPVDTLMLGTVSYTKDQLLSILKQPVKGNGLVSLAHQLIAAKLNVANGATCTAITATISSADAAIGSLSVPPVGGGSLSTSSVSNFVSQLDQFNNGLTSGCPGHCSE